MAQQINCKVDNCIHNCDCKCDASSIKVNTCNCKSAKDCEQTECDTFECK